MAGGVCASLTWGLGVLGFWTSRWYIMGAAGFAAGVAAVLFFWDE